jgi:hypothetical protein
MRVVVLVFLILILGISQASAAVRSIRSRTVNEPPEIVMQGIANVTFDTLLGERMIYMTVRNDANPTTIKIDLEIEISPFDSVKDSEWDGTIFVSLLKGLAANETFTFDNSTIATQINSYVDTDGDSGFQLDSFDMGEGDFDGGYPGGFTMDTFDFGGGNIDLSAFEELKNLPQGDYSITLTATEHNVANPKTSSRTLFFKIVGIGQINFASLPSVEDQRVSWQLPEIPNYDTTASNEYEVYSILNITGKDVNFTKEIEHANPTGTGIKGYPGGTDNGAVSLDLAPYNLKFRMGETYTFELQFKDWGRVDVAQESVRTITYTSRNPDYFTPSSGEQVAELLPTFEWAFDDYQEWVSYYDLYLNGVKQNTTRITDEYYTLAKPLTFGTSYSWYVVPYYTDWTPFYSPASPPARNQFSTINHTSPDILVSGVSNGDMLLTGQNYTLSVSAETFNDAEVESITWNIGGTSLSGQAVSYTPTRRYTNGSLTLTCTVTDSEGGRSVEQINLTVLDPAVTIAGGDRDVFARDQVTFSIDSARSRDVQEYIWIIRSPQGDEVTESGTNVGYSFDQLGTYTVTATAFSEDSEGNEKEVSSDAVDVRVTSQGPPQVALISPNAMDLIPVGVEVPFTASISSPNEIASTIWIVNGTQTAFEGIQEDFILTATSGMLSSGRPSAVTVICRTIDEFGVSADVSRDVMVIDPAVSITNLSDGDRWALDKPLQPSIAAGYASQVLWYVDDHLQSGLSHTFTRPGEHTLRASASWDIIGSSGSTETFEEQTEVTIYVIDSTPPSLAITGPQPAAGAPLLTDVEYLFTGEVRSDSSISRMWWIIGDDTIETDDGSVRHTFPSGSTSSSVKVSFHAENADGVASQISTQIAVIDPVILVQQPPQSQFAAGSSLPFFGAVSSGSLLWRIEGTTRTGDSFYLEEANSSWNKKISEPGTYTLTPGWSLTAASTDGGSQEFTRFGDSSYEITIFSLDPPIITAVFPQLNVLRQRTGAPVTFSLSAESENSTPEIQWSVLSGTTVVESASGTQFTYQAAEPGSYTIKSRAVDQMGLATERTWSLYITDPQLAITYPEAGTRYGNRAFTSPKATSQDISNITYYLDGSQTPVPDGFNWETLTAGEHSIRAEGTYLTVVDETGEQQATVSSQTQRFTIVNLAPPVVTLSDFSQSERVLAGESYTVTAEVSGQDGARIEQVVWTLDGESIATGEQVEFNTGDTVGNRTLTVTAEDQYGLRTSVTTNLRVINPTISVTLPEYSGRTGIYPADIPVTLRYSGSDIEEVSWSLNDREYDTNRFRFTPGTFNVSVKGSAHLRLPDGSYGTYVVEPAQPSVIQVFGQVLPTDTAVTPAQSITGSQVRARTTISGPLEAVASISWLLDGAVIQQTDSPTSAESTVTIPSPKLGTRSLGVRVTDIFGRTTVEQKNFSVFPELELSMQSPADRGSFGPAERIPLAGAVSDARTQSMIDRYYWQVDGQEVAGSDFLTGYLPPLSAGEHTVSFGAVDTMGNTTQVERTVSVQSDLLLSLKETRDRITILEGTSHVLRASARALSAQVDITTLTDHIIWFVDGREQGSGLSFTFEPDAPGTYTVSARYEVGSVSRRTRDLTVVVQDFPEPRITEPAANTVFYYSPGQSLQFSGTGFEQASYTWLLDGNTIGRSSQFTFTPQGLQGSYRLQLITEHLGLSSLTDHMITFEPNTSPTVTLSLPGSTFFTGGQLTWEASAIDIEDGLLEPVILLDGIRISSDEEFRLTDADAGSHELRARVTDSRGLSSEQQVSFTVIPGITGLTVQNPQTGDLLIEDKPVTLSASLEGGSSSDSAGAYEWEITYFDVPGGMSEQLSGNRVQFTPNTAGAAQITARFIPADGQPPVEQRLDVTIEAEPVEMTLYWPHGSVVNAGTQLAPELLGLAGEQASEAAVTWLIDGKPVTGTALRAPQNGGEHILAVQLEQDGRITAQDQIAFTVNEAPTVTITSPSANPSAVAGSSVILTAQVSDDQGGSPTVTWMLPEGEVAGTGDTIALSDLPVGTHTITAVAVDTYGLSSRDGDGTGADSITLTIFDPLIADNVTVNSGIGTYLLGSGSPLGVSTSITGGVDPVVTWRVLQAAESVQASGRSTVLPVDENRFSSGTATVRITVEDRGAVQIVRDLPILFADQASVMITSPETDSPFWLKDRQMFEVTAVGFPGPTITSSINGTEVSNTSVEISSGAQEAVYAVTVDTSQISSEGVYELSISVTANNLTREDTYMMNIYSREPGIEFTQIPEKLDLTSDSPAIAAAEAFGLGDVSLQWFSSASERLISDGQRIDLRQIPFTPGRQNIIVQAVDESGTVLANASFELPVLGQMRLSITPEDERITVAQGAQIVITAEALDIDGNILPGEAVSWSSHRAGPVHTGLEFAPGTSPLEPGDHMLIIEAVGSGGDTVQSVAAVTIRASDSGAGGREQIQEQEGPPSGPRTSYSSGRNIGETGTDSQTVSTVITVSGTVRKVTDGDRDQVTESTSFTAGDVIELRGRNAEVMLLNTDSREIVTLNDRNATYTWNSSSSSWEEE